MSCAKIQILLATYNSGEYLREQLESLLKQDYRDFQILIRDGGSRDNTLNIIREYQEKYPEKICFLGTQRASALENFSELLKSGDSELFMFCDHDDVWLPQKISRTLAKYRETEVGAGSETPILIFTDSYVTDQRLEVISPSMLQFQNLNPEFLSLNRLIVQNVPFGNTMLFNRALAKLSLPVPPEAVMHDHWISLTASAFGKIVFLNEPTLYYRQHNANVYGASQYSLGALIRKFRNGREKIIGRFEQNIRQAAVFGEKYKTMLSDYDRKMLQELSGWQTFGFWKKRQVLWKYRILKTGMLRNIAMFLLI